MKNQNRGKAETVTDQKVMIITQPSLKVQHLHHWQEKRPDCLLQHNSGFFLDHTYKQGRKWAFYICSLVFLTVEETRKPVFIQGI